MKAFSERISNAASRIPELTQMDWHQQITSDPTILGGKAVVRGTRIPVDLILEELVPASRLMTSWRRASSLDW